ncbi:C6 transcription factor [Colletotrichum musicola]|uniref:C6 transcription factor n=1 Tax=Colletotrichum musicola TaxID=2175873 RepID=A0A8H6KH00_9PEZI|nr:C6 transcription factor [Colletotrichum musicola]
MKRLPSIRSAVACVACHKQKLKCNGGTPCQRCQTRQRSCVYPAREKFIMVHESYVRGLEHNIKEAKRVLEQSPPSSGVPPRDPTGAETLDFAAPLSPPRTARAVKEETSGDCGSEHICEHLKKLSQTAAASSDDDNSRSPGSGAAQTYTYSRLKFDFLQPEVSFRLPPRPYAFHLLEAFEEGFSEYHWFLRRSFYNRLVLTYSDPASQSHDRNWLCRVSVVLALAESFSRSRMTSSTGQPPLRPYAALPPPPMTTTASAAMYSADSPSSADNAPLPPGSDFFEQGLMLLKTSSEEPTPEDVEALNLIALYCYSLNRRKTAYSYASQSVALAKLLQLHKPSSGQDSSGSGTRSRVLDEHRKRLWWTSYYMDRMTSTELGVAPAFCCVPEGMQLPSSAGLTPDEAEQFSDPSLLTAAAQLCEIKRDVVRTAAQHGGSEKRLDAIQASLDMLQQWRAGLPGVMDFTFEDSLPTRLMDSRHGRILASIYMRYHQCFILLLRPIYLQKLSLIVQKRRHTSQSAAASPNLLCGGNPEGEGAPMVALKMQCLQAARNNCKILLGLWHYDKIAKFGYWESLHLFSGLAILALAQVSIDGLAACPDEDDSGLYAQTRAVLGEMARAGNPAAKDHDVLLTDVEAMVDKVSKEKASAGLTGMDFDLSGGTTDFFSDFSLAGIGLDQNNWYGVGVEVDDTMSTMTQAYEA